MRKIGARRGGFTVGTREWRVPSGDEGLLHCGAPGDARWEAQDRSFGTPRDESSERTVAVGAAKICFWEEPSIPAEKIVRRDAVQRHRSHGLTDGRGFLAGTLRSLLLARAFTLTLPVSVPGRILLVLALLAGGGSLESWATPPPARNSFVTTATSDSIRPVVRQVEIRGNRHFSDGRLKKHIRTRRNRRILGIPGFTWWRWVYRFGSADWMWDRLGRALKAGGEPPAYLDSTTVRGDVERLRTFYEQNGFFRASVRSSIRSTADADRVRVVFTVTPGPGTHIRRARYDGLDVLPPDERRRLIEETVLDIAEPADTVRTSFRVDKQRYQKSLLLDERRRMLSFLQNAGYAAVSRDSIRALVDTSATPAGSLDVTFRVQPGPQYRFGDVHFRITGPEDVPPRRDTLSVPGGDSSGRVTVEIEDESQLGSGLLRRALQLRPGDVYDQSQVLATKQRLEGTGIFTLTNLTPQFDGVTRRDSISYLPLLVEGQTQQRHRLRLETFGLQRGSEIDFESNEFGIGLGGEYRNVNALGGGETFRLRASGSVATSTDNLEPELFTSTQFRGSASLTLPYLIRPFGQFENIFDLTNARTQISVSALTARRNDLNLRIRSRNSARLRLEMNHTPSRLSLVDVFDLSVSNPDTLAGFQEDFLSLLFEGVRDPVQRAQILEDYTQPQINTALRYTFRAITANPLRRQQGHIYEFAAEVGNSLPLLFDRFIFAPGTLDYSLPGLTGGGGRGLRGRLLYRPYVRGTVDLRRYVPISQGSTVAFKFFGGMAHPTADPTVVPFDRRFFSGGGTSVRGWRLRDLGPGGAGQPADATGAGRGSVTSLLGGDIKLETSVELRTTLLRNILAADWLGATFVDVGNMWFGPRNLGFGASGRSGADLAQPVPSLSGDETGRFRGFSSLADVGVGTGAGIRIEWAYLLVRFDLAYRLHDPSPENQDLLSGTSEGPLLHFGIGHAF